MTRRRITEQVRVESIGMSRRGVTTVERPMLRFAISSDVIEELFRLHDELYKVYFFGERQPENRLDRHRIEFARLMDIHIPAVLMRIEPPTYHPHGAKLWLPKGSRQYRTTVLARKLRVKSGIERKNLELLPSPEMRGILCVFPDEDMELPTDGALLGPRRKQIPINDQDMAVYR